MMIWFLCIAFLLTAIAGRLYAGVWKRNLSCRISFSDRTVYAGDQITLEEAVTNQKKLPLPQVEVGFRLPRGVYFQDAENIVVSDYIYKRDVFSLRGMEMVVRRYQMQCRSRGRYPVSQVVLKTKALLHGKEYILEPEGADCPGKDPLLVYPGYTDVSEIERLCDTILGTTESRNSLYEDPFLFSGIRDYLPSDPMNRINWKAMARTGKLMVNTYASVRDLSCMIFLDVADRKILKEEDLVEESIRIAATLCRRMILHSQMTGLAVNTDPPLFFGPERGRELLSRIEYALTENFAAAKLTDFAGLFERIPERTNLPAVSILISRDLKKEEIPPLGSPAILVTPVREEGGTIRCRLTRC